MKGYGTGSVSDLSFDRMDVRQASGRSRSPYGTGALDRYFRRRHSDGHVLGIAPVCFTRPGFDTAEGSHPFDVHSAIDALHGNLRASCADGAA